MVEQRPFKPKVVGSIPTAPTKACCFQCVSSLPSRQLEHHFSLTFRSEVEEGRRFQRFAAFAKKSQRCQPAPESPPPSLTPCGIGGSIAAVSVSLICRRGAARPLPKRMVTVEESTCLASRGSRSAIGYNRLGNRCQDWRAGRQHHQTLRFMAELMEDHIRNHMPRQQVV